MVIKHLLSCIVAFIALVNPIQKIFIISSLQKQFDKKTTNIISLRATITALYIEV